MECKKFHNLWESLTLLTQEEQEPQLSFNGFFQGKPVKSTLQLQPAINKH